MAKNKKESQRKTPVLRFKGFNDDWEQRELGKYRQVIMGQSPQSKNYTQNPNDYILIQGNADLKNGKIFPRVYTTQLTKIANPEDIILTVRAPVREVAITDRKVVLGRGVAALRSPKIVYYLLQKFKQDKKWDMYSSGSTFNSITSSDLQKICFRIPSKKERIKIEQLLELFDNLLAHIKQEDYLIY